MAKAAMCKICGTAHWANEPHKFRDQAPEAAAPKPATATEPSPHAIIVGSGAFGASPAGDARDRMIADLKAEIEALRPDAMAWRARKAANAARMKARRG